MSNAVCTNSIEPTSIWPLINCGHKTDDAEAERNQETISLERVDARNKI
jgi:hypothetical protein